MHVNILRARVSIFFWVVCWCDKDKRSLEL
jgi:hypothetical protein